MQFSIFQNPLNTWQGNSLIIGLFEEDIFKQLEKYNGFRKNYFNVSQNG